MEKTVEEMESKLEKLESNFNYIYEKMSAIEYDNASFKDKLSIFMAQSKTSSPKNETS